MAAPAAARGTVPPAVVATRPTLPGIAQG